MTGKFTPADQLALQARNLERAEAVKQKLGPAWLLHSSNTVKRNPNAKQPVLFRKGLV
jgi:hypothetical protein